METPNLFSALAKAQSEMKPPHKNKTVTVRPKTSPPYTFEYADYGAIVEAIRGPLSRNGIAFTHRITENEKGQFSLVTSLHFGVDDLLESAYPLPDATDPKALGGAITYGKRYCLSALVGIAADDDDDAGDDRTVSFGDRRPSPPAASPPEPAKSGVLKVKDVIPPEVKHTITPRASSGEAPKARGTASVPGPSDAMLARLFTIAGQNNWTNEQVKLLIETRYGLNSTRGLSREEYDETVYTVAHQTYRSAVMEPFGKV